MSTAQHIDIDWTACQGHGLCADFLPEHITLDEWGYPWSTAPRSPPTPCDGPGGQPPTARSSHWR